MFVHVLAFGMFLSIQSLDFVWFLFWPGFSSLFYVGICKLILSFPYLVRFYSYLLLVSIACLHRFCYLLYKILHAYGICFATTDLKIGFQFPYADECLLSVSCE